MPFIILFKRWINTYYNVLRLSVAIFSYINQAVLNHENHYIYINLTNISIFNYKGPH